MNQTLLLGLGSFQKRPGLERAFAGCLSLVPVDREGADAVVVLQGGGEVVDTELRAHEDEDLFQPCGGGRGTGRLEPGHLPQKKGDSRNTNRKQIKPT